MNDRTDDAFEDGAGRERSAIDRALAEVRSTLESLYQGALVKSPTADTSPAPERPTAEPLEALEASRRFDAARDQASVLEILTSELVRGDARCRILLKTPGSTKLRCWRSEGFDDALRGEDVASDSQPIEECLRSARCIVLDGSATGQLPLAPSSATTTSALIPLLLRGEVSALAYVEDPPSVGHAQHLCYLATLTLETLAVRTASSTALEEPLAWTVTESDDELASETETEPPDEVVAPIETAAPAATGPLGGSTEPTEATEPGESAAPPQPPAQTQRLPSATLEALRELEKGDTDTIATASAPLESPAEETVAPASAAKDIGGTSQVLPPTNHTGRGSAFEGSVEETPNDDPRHDEAKRLARLLVSELKLYNEEQIAEGIRSGSIYEQLRDDIDRSRQMYEERVDDGVRAVADYFQDELVSSLAGGDATVLGIGARVPR